LQRQFCAPPVRQPQGWKRQLTADDFITTNFAFLAEWRFNEYRLDYAKERTVFVVQAKFLDEFLKQFQVDIGWRETLRL
jgi:hypothetical protein